MLSHIYYEQFSGDISTLMIILMFAAAVGSILGGLLSEVFSYKKVYVVISIIGAALIIPAFKTISYSGYSTMQIRYTAVAIIYNIAVALFIGLSPAFLSIVLPLLPTPLLPAYLLLSAFCFLLSASKSYLLSS
jgi:MFS-type transporter involved in bile tolerance (Atg22 family)